LKLKTESWEEYRRRWEAEDRLYELKRKRRRKMKIMWWVLSGVMVLILAGAILADVLAGFAYDKTIGSYWDLSVKASTIQKKSEYLDQFVSAIEGARLAEYDAVFLKTPNNSTAQNIVALKSLQGRMHAIIGMDENSFQYQQAMQQITGQEQDEAKDMLETFCGAWYLENHPFLWGWIGGVWWTFLLVLAVVFGFCGYFAE
jgi:hypothetical protein